MRGEHNTYSTICGTPVQVILDQNNLTGLAGGGRRIQNMAQKVARAVNQHLVEWPPPLHLAKISLNCDSKSHQLEDHEDQSFQHFIRGRDILRYIFRREQMHNTDDKRAYSSAIIDY